MKVSGLINIAAGLWAACIMLAPDGHCETIKVGGTGGANALMTELGALYASQDAVSLEIVPSLGSSGGMRALIDGVLDIAMSGRLPTAEEAAKGLTIELTLLTPFVFASSHPNPSGMAVKDLQQSYLALRPTWRDGTPLHIILRPKSDSDSGLVGQLFPGIGAAIAELRRRPDLPIAATDQDNVVAAELTSGSLIATSYAQVLLEKRKLRFVAIDGIAPSIHALESGAYRHAKPFYLIAAASRKASVVRFIDWLRSPDRQNSLRALHVVKGK